MQILVYTRQRIPEKGHPSTKLLHCSLSWCHRTWSPKQPSRSPQVLLGPSSTHQHHDIAGLAGACPDITSMRLDDMHTSYCQEAVVPWAQAGAHCWPITVDSQHNLRHFSRSP
jgi:hypothetical protein